MHGMITGLQLSDGGVPKLPVPAAEIAVGGLVGDRQRNLKVHGGPDRAVCLLAQEVIDALVSEGHPITRGSTGENITIAGLEWGKVQLGDRLKLGATVVLEFTTYTLPCKNISPSFLLGDHTCLGHEKHPGRARIYARVLVPGHVTVGDSVSLITG